MCMRERDVVCLPLLILCVLANGVNWMIERACILVCTRAVSRLAPSHHVIASELTTNLFA